MCDEDDPSFQFGIINEYRWNSSYSVLGKVIGERGQRRDDDTLALCSPCHRAELLTKYKFLNKGLIRNTKHELSSVHQLQNIDAILLRDLEINSFTPSIPKLILKY